MSTPVETPPVLETRQLTKTFRHGNEVVEAVKDVTLRLEEGEFVAVMGASGSGKSTLLHLIAGLTRPDSGRVVVEGQDLADLRDGRLTRFRRRRIGLVFQSYNLIPALSAEDNILLPVLADGRGRPTTEKLEELLEQLALLERRRHRPDALSGGEQQRVAIARALVSDPAVLLADEPTGNLDSVTTQDICRLLRKLRDEQHRTILLVTHEPAVAVWAQRVLILKDGRNLTEFSTAELDDAQHLAARYQDIVSTAAEMEASR